MTVGFTMSALSRVLNCPSSAALPKAETASVYADAGNDEHEELADDVGNPAHDFAHLIPAGARSEVRVAYDIVARTGRILGEGVGRAYGVLGENEIAGSIDVLAVVDGRVVVIDWKTGYLDVEPASRNGQLWGYALAAARALQAAGVAVSGATVMIVYTKTKVVDAHDLDAMDLADFAEQLDRARKAVVYRRIAHDAGQALDTNEGAWCRHCASKYVCPSKTGLLVQIAERGLAVIGDTQMTPDRARDAYLQIQRLDQMVKDAKKRLDQYADDVGPIDLGDGIAYGRYIKKGNERVDATIALQAIHDVAGEFVDTFVGTAMEMSTSKAAIERAAKACGQPQLKKAVLERTRHLGGIKSDEKRPIGEFNTAKHAAVTPIEFPVEAIDKLLAEAS